MTRRPRIEQDARRLCRAIFGVVVDSGVEATGAGWAAFGWRNRVRLYRSRYGGQCAELRMSGDGLTEMCCTAGTRKEAMRRLMSLAKGLEPEATP